MARDDEKKAGQYHTIRLEAMVWDDQIAGRDGLRNWVFDYRNLDKFLSPEQNPFGNNRSAKERGIWLRWILPPSLRSERDDGGFLPLPNRFLITRVSENTDEICSKVLETDCPLSGCMDDTAYYRVLPYTTVYMIGETEKEQLCASRDPYRSQGYYQKAANGGGYYVNFGVPFPAEEWEERDGGEPFLTACAPGNPDFTGYIRFHSNMLAFFDDLKDHAPDTFHYFVTGWYSAGAHSGHYYSGQIFSVKWNKEGFPVSDESDPYGDELHRIRRTGKLNAAIGENSQDAFRAWLKKKLLHDRRLPAGQENALEWILAAFLSEDTARLEEQDGGWRLRDRLQDDRFEAAYGGTKETAELDREIEILHALQEELQAVWWKKGYLEALKKTESVKELEKELDPQTDGSLLARTICQFQKVRLLYSEYKELFGSEKTRQLGRYWRSKDPYLLISGAQEPEDLEQEESPARIRDDIMRDAAYVPKVKGSIPEGVTVLWQEAFYILRHIYPDKGESAGCPVKLWHQPWKPAFMEWRICYEDLETFQFNGYEYEIPRLGQEDPRRQSGFTGWTALDNHKKHLFVKRLDAMEKVLSKEKVDEIKREAENWKLLGQELSGLTEQMGQRDLRAFRRPCRETIPGTDLTMEELLGYASADPEFLERVGGMGESVPCVRDNIIPKYRYVRAGRGCLKDLILYDAFGRVLELISSGDQKGLHSSDRFPLIVSGSMRGLQEEQGYGFALKPSLLQYCRLHAAVEEKEGGPFLGFMIPNYLTHSLLLYGGQGEELGELLAVAAENRERKLYFQWRMRPDDRERAQAVWKELFSFIHAMEQRPADDLGLFLDALEASFWTMEASGKHMEQRRALLAGRPLALSKLNLYLQRRGLPKKDGGWNRQYTEEEKYDAQTFPVHLGNPSMRGDGLSGYFLNDDFSVFYSTAKPETDNAFVKETGSPGTPYIMTGFGKEHGAAPWIVYDPLLAVHIYTGILPVKRIQQEKESVLKTLDKMIVSLRMGPVAQREEQGRTVIREGYFTLQPDESDESQQSDEADMGKRI